MRQLYIALLISCRLGFAEEPCHYGIAALVREHPDARAELVPGDRSLVFQGGALLSRGTQDFPWQLELKLGPVRATAYARLEALYEVVCEGSLDSTGRELDLMCREPHGNAWTPHSWRVYYDASGPRPCPEANP